MLNSSSLKHIICSSEIKNKFLLLKNIAIEKDYNRGKKLENDYVEKLLFYYLVSTKHSKKIFFLLKI